MNDFDDTDISRAYGARAIGAPTHRPDFGDVLAARAQRLRRRSAIGATAAVAIGITGLAALAGNGGDMPSAADGPGPSDGLPTDMSTTTWLANSEALWYCEGAVDLGITIPIATTTTIPVTSIPVTTIGPTGVDLDEPAFVPPTEDSGFYRHCELVQPGLPAPTPELDNRFPTTTVLFDERVPPATESTANSGVPVITDEAGMAVDSEAGRYVVQSGDYAILIADKFDVSLDDLVSFNGWDSAAEFPFPGEVVLIPPSTPIDVAPTTTTTSLLAPSSTNP